ncbi:MAG: methyltransferase domain-containing protein [Smithellaceae bacterium]|nr:methyltransferase domain-containing protein [Smithellaceae bacterium]
MKTHLFEKALAILGLAHNRDYQVLDFGCGTGGFLGLLSKSIGKGSQLIGCDAVEKSIAQARLDYPNAEFVRHRFTDELPFPDAAFDIFVTIDTLECIKNKEALTEEIHRVLKPNGQVLAMHWDWDTQTYAIPTRELARKAVRAFSDWKQPWMDDADGQMGRKLWGLFERSGKFHGVPDTFCLVETDYKAGKYGYDRALDLSGLVEQGGFDKSEYEQFHRELTESCKKGEYFYSVTSYVYLGRRA